MKAVGVAALIASAVAVVDERRGYGTAAPVLGKAGAGPTNQFDVLGNYWRGYGQRWNEW